TAARAHHPGIHAPGCGNVFDGNNLRKVRDIADGQHHRSSDVHSTCGTHDASTWELLTSCSNTRDAMGVFIIKNHWNKPRNGTGISQESNTFRQRRFPQVAMAAGLSAGITHGRMLADDLR